jgi:hypothetical protein
MHPVNNLRKEINMKLILLHGRDNPNEDMTDWGYLGPDIENVRYIHSVYSNFTIGFKSRRDAILAHSLTGWPFFDDMVLEMCFFDDLVVCCPENKKKSYYGDWELQED